MTNLIIKLFIKNHTDIKKASIRDKHGKVAGLVGIFTNLFLFIVKIIFGILSASIAIIADAINNLSDAGSSIITLFGFYLAAKPADKEHPFGHQRIEYITGLIISFIIVMLSLQLAISSVQKIINPEEFVFSYILIAILIICIFTKLWQGFFYKKIGEKINSTTLKATSQDSFNDVIATTSVLISAVATKLLNFNFDGYMGVVVSIIIFISGVKLIGETINPLLGIAPDKALVKKIKSKTLSYDYVLGMHDLTLHNYGYSRCFASVHVEMDAKEDILVCHDIIDNIERDFKKEFDINLVIHLDPVVTDDEAVRDLHTMVLSVVNDIDEKITIHDFRVVVGTTHTNIIFDICIPFEYEIKDIDLKEMIMDNIKKINKSYYAVIMIDHIYY